MDGLSSTVQVDGVAEALKALNRCLPELKRQVVKDIRAAGAPAVESVRKLIPAAAPLSGWAAHSWRSDTSGAQLGYYDPASVRNGVKVQFRGSKVRGAQNPDVIPLLRLRMVDPAGVIFDMGGRRSSGKNDKGRRFLGVLQQRGGSPSRFMWPGAERALPAVSRQVEEAVDGMIKVINTELR